MSSRRGPRNREPLPRSVQISKKFAWLLRHGAESENLPLGPGGYANLADVLANRKIRSLRVTLAEVQELVADNDKQRFSLLPVSADTSPSAAETSDAAAAAVTAAGGVGGNGDPADPRNYIIRANQGHSVKVDAESLLTPIEEGRNVPAVAVHGTSHRAWAAIVASGGLRLMGRNHVHMAAGLPAGFGAVGEGGAETAAAPVISGMRVSSTVLVYVDVERAMRAGLKFWLSENGVILSEGNAEGLIPMEFFRRVEDRTGEGVLVLDGKVVKEAPAKWGQGKG